MFVPTTASTCAKHFISQGKLAFAAYIVLFHFLLWTVYRVKHVQLGRRVYAPVEISTEGQQPLWDLNKRGKMCRIPGDQKHLALKAWGVTWIAMVFYSKYLSK